MAAHARAQQERAHPGRSADGGRVVTAAPALPPDRPRQGDTRRSGEQPVRLGFPDRFSRLLREDGIALMRSSLLSVAIKAAGIALLLVVSVVLARHLGAAEYGRL